MSNTSKPKSYADLTHDEHRERYVPKFPEGKGWKDMDPIERRAFLRASTELGCKKGYDAARAFTSTWESTPEWEELTDAQRQNIRDEQVRQAQEMHEFGKSLGESMQGP